MCELDREKYPSERTVLDEVPERLCRAFKWKCLSDDRVDLARPEKLCNRGPMLLPAAGKIPVIRSPQI